MDKHTQHAPKVQMRSVLTLKGVRRESMQPPARPAELSIERFAFVWSPDRRRPRQRHPTRELAEAEALRLATQVPGVLFLVYEATCTGRFLK